jgi:phosphoenolpyruvate synthase/pyruvate phosphate dikinase
MYVVDKASGAILERQVSAQEEQFVRLPDAPPGEEPCGWAPVPFEVRAQQKLTDEQIGELADLGDRLETHFGRPQDIEWAWAAGQFYILQARPVTAAG